MNPRPTHRSTNIISTRVLRGWILFSLCISVSATDAAEPQPARKTASKGNLVEKNQADQQKKSETLFDGKKMGKWKVADKYDFQAHGPVVVKNGAIDLAPGSPASGIYYTGKLPRIDYEISLDAKRTTGSDFFCGMTFPIKKSYCTLIVGGWGGSLIGLSNIDGAAASENSACTVGEFKNNQWYKIRLRITSAKIEVWIDKEKVIDQTTEDHKFTIWWEQEPMRPLGIATWGTGAAIKNIKLKKLGKTGSEHANQ